MFPLVTRFSPITTAMVGPGSEFSPESGQPKGTEVHYYSFNIGDYARDTGHLTVLEHGIYRLLMDWCYLNEKPITTEQAIRVSRGNPEETQSVLSEFFRQDSDGWRHTRIDAVISRYHAKALQNKENGSKGGRPKPKNNPLGSQSDAKHNPNQEPITNNQEPYKEESADASSAGVSQIHRKRETQALFDKFWSAYPRKVAKENAMKAFAKRKPDEQMLGEMLKAVAVQAASDGWQKDGGQFIPHAATWLNAGRWQDEVGDSSAGTNLFVGAI
jgi:uncharacterized protein YdaU (DUF1376 family)